MVNICIRFGFSEAVVRMLMRNRSMNVIHQHYIQTAKAYESHDSWANALTRVNFNGRALEKFMNSWTRPETQDDIDLQSDILD